MNSIKTGQTYVTINECLLSFFIISKRALVSIFLNETICSVLWQYSDSPLIQAAPYSFRYSQNTDFLPPLHLGEKDIGIWDLISFKWLHVYSENSDGCFQTFKTSPLFHHMSTSHFWWGMSLYGKDAYRVSTHSRTYPSVATCARQGGGVAAPLSDCRATVYAPEPKRPPGATRTYLFATFARQDIRCERGTALSAPFVCAGCYVPCADCVTWRFRLGAEPRLL